MELDYKAIGVRVKNFRKERNLTQEKLAELIDVSVPYMSNIETGKKKLSMKVLVNLSCALDVTPDELLLGYLDTQDKTVYSPYEAIYQDLEDCTTAQIAMIAEIIASTKRGLRLYDHKKKEEIKVQII